MLHIMPFPWVASLWIAAAAGLLAGWYLARWVYKEARRPAGGFGPTTLSLHSFTINAIIMKIALHAGKEVPVVLGKPVKKDGSPAEIQEGSLVIKVLDADNNDAEHIVSWERDDEAANPDDPYTGKLVWRSAGSATLVVNGDADLGEGVETIALEVDIEALDEEAIGFADPTVGAERDHVEESPEASEQV